MGLKEKAITLTSSKGAEALSKKIGELITNLKNKTKNGWNEREKALKILKEFKDVSVSNAQNAKQVVQEKTIKSFSLFSSIAFQLPFLILFIYSVWNFNLAPIVFNSIITLLNYVENILHPMAIYWTGLLITGLILIVTLMYLLPNIKNETRDNFIKKIITFLLWYFAIIFIWGGIYNSSFYQTQTIEEQGTVVSQNVQKEAKSLWEVIICAFDFSGECLKQQQQTQTAQEVDNTGYSITYSSQNIATLTKTLDSWQKFPTNLQYRIESNGDLQILELNCYHTSIKEENKFYTQDFRDEGKIISNTNGEKIPIQGLKCDYSNLEHSNKDQTDELTIIPTLKIKVKTNFQIPLYLISQEKYYNFKGLSQQLDGYLAYLDPETIKYFKEEVDYEIRKDSDALILKTQNIKDMMPLIFGNNEEYEFEIPIVIEANPDSRLGNLISANTVNEPTITEFFALTNTEYGQSFEISQDNEMIYLLYLKENEELASNLDLILNEKTIELSIESVFEYRSTQSRYKIRINDPNFGKKENEMQTLNQVISELNTLKNEFTNFKNSYPNQLTKIEQIQSKITLAEEKINLASALKAELEKPPENLENFETLISEAKTLINEGQNLIKTEN